MHCHEALSYFQLLDNVGIVLSIIIKYYKFHNTLFQYWIIILGFFEKLKIGFREEKLLIKNTNLKHE